MQNIHGTFFTLGITEMIICTLNYLVLEVLR